MNFHRLQVVGRGSETQFQGGENLSIVTKREEGSIHNKVYSHTHWWCFHYETYCDISRYRTPLYYMYSYTCCMHACCIAGERLVLWSFVMSVNCTLICAVENFRQSCEKIQKVFIFVRYGKIQHMSKEKVFA